MHNHFINAKKKTWNCLSKHKWFLTLHVGLQRRLSLKVVKTLISVTIDWWDMHNCRCACSGLEDLLEKRSTWRMRDQISIFCGNAWLPMKSAKIHRQRSFPVQPIQFAVIPRHQFLIALSKMSKLEASSKYFVSQSNIEIASFELSSPQFFFSFW